jgi:predicted alpha/beta-fold hydrolase
MVIEKGRLGRRPNLDDLEDYVVAPMFGYRDRLDYKQKVSVAGKLHLLKTPCFYLHADDDFIVGKEGVPREEF